MSRCFPFPPPGYVRNGARSEALIESIKLQKEMEKAKKDRKKEKKEKKREKKERRKERKLKEATICHPSDGKRFKHIDELKETRADGKLQKDESEQLERSGITEEQDPPVSSRELCCLSDSTQSSKRKRSPSPSCHDHGAAIKIRLPLRKHREPEESKIEVQLGSSDSLTQRTSGSDNQLQCVTNAEAKQSLGKTNSRHCKASQNLVHGDALITNNIHDDEGQRMASMYNTLFQIHPLTSEGFDSDDQDWLFRSDLTQAKPVSKTVKSVTDAVRCSTPSLWPRAQYLPAVELYALPYTVPF